MSCLQFRLAYVSRESRVVGAGDLVDHPKRIALHYLKGYFLIDLFVVFPLPQVNFFLFLVIIRFENKCFLSSKLIMHDQVWS